MKDVQIVFAIDFLKLEQKDLNAVLGNIENVDQEEEKAKSAAAAEDPGRAGSWDNRQVSLIQVKSQSRTSTDQANHSLFIKKYHKLSLRDTELEEET